MRKITQQAVEAFTNGGDYKKDNTEVKTYSDGIAKMYLHGNLIADFNHKTKVLYITDAGWQTTTTKERLNGILEYFELGHLKQVKGEWYIINGDNKELFNGEKTFDI